MNKKFLVSWLVAFVVLMGGSFLIHGVLLNDGYAGMQQLYRTEEDTQGYMHWMLIAHVIIAGAFVWIYQRGVSSDAWVGQGLRFGAAIALFGPVSTNTIYYVVQPLPGAFVVKAIVLEVILFVVTALVVAFMNKPAESG